MIIDDIKNIKSGKRELRKFGITFSIVLVLLGGLCILRNKDYYSYLFIFSITFLFLSLAAPTVLKPVQKIWISLSIVIGWSIARIILIILFYFIVTPTGILARIFGKEFLDLKFGRKADSYWISRRVIRPEKRNYEKQF